MICATPGCARDCMPERDICARCVYAAMAAKAAATPPPRPGARRTPDDDPGAAILAADRESPR